MLRNTVVKYCRTDIWEGETKSVAILTQLAVLETCTSGVSLTFCEEIQLRLYLVRTSGGYNDSFSRLLFYDPWWCPKIVSQAANHRRSNEGRFRNDVAG